MIHISLLALLFSLKVKYEIKKIKMSSNSCYNFDKILITSKEVLTHQDFDNESNFQCFKIDDFLSQCDIQLQ